MHPLTALFLLALAAAVGLRLYLAFRQGRRLRAGRDRVPEPFRAWVAEGVHRFAVDYALARLRLEAAETLWTALLAWGWTLGGGIELLTGAWRATGLDPLVAGTGALVSALLLGGVLELPLAAWRTFGVERRFGFNRTSPGLFLADALREAALVLLLGTPLAAALLALLRGAGEAWWLMGWLLWSAFTLLLAWAWPALIAPWFHRFTPLPSGELRRRLEALLARCGFRAEGLYVSDASRRSAHGNAYLVGLGQQRRIVLYDTLLETLAPEEVEAVLAHELGHHALGHVRRRLALGLALSLGAFAVLGWLAEQPWFHGALGVATPSPEATLLLFLQAGWPFAALARPMAAAWARRQELEADAFAASLVPPQHLAEALMKLYVANGEPVVRDPLYAAYHDSHPAAAERVARLLARGRPEPAGI